MFQLNVSSRCTTRVLATACVIPGIEYWLFAFVGTIVDASIGVMVLLTEHSDSGT